MWAQDESGRVRTPLEPVMLAATLAVVPALLLQVDSSGRWYQAAVAANWVIWLVFLGEFVSIMVMAPRRSAALRAHWLDLAVVVVTAPLFGRFLSSLRLVRLARLLRLTRAGLLLWRAVAAERRLTSATTLRVVALMTLFIVVVAGSAETAFDAGEFGNVWDGIWWATVTITTVGYGDLYPKTVTGRLIGMAVMLIGIGFLSVLTAAVASYFVKSDQRDDNTEVLTRLQRIEEELAALRTQLGA